VRAAAAESGLSPGDPARPESVLAAEDAMREALRRAGHPLAAVAGREAVVDHDRRTMDVTWRLAAGPRATFAAPEVTGQVRTNTGLLERTVARQIEGQDYSPAALERARRALVALGVFESVRIEAAMSLAPGDRLPVTFRVAERPLRAFGGTLSYETNYGAGVSLFWEHRNLFGGAERLRLEGEVARLAEGDFSNATYRAFATLTLPEIWRRDIRLIARAGAVRELLDAYDRDAILVSALAERRLSERTALQAGPQFETGRIGRYGDLEPFTLVGFVMGLRWDGTTSLLDPTSGARASVTATPWWSLDNGVTYTRLLAIGSTYLDVTGDQRGVLALRGAVGAAVGATRDEITLDKRFYAGGGGSVRGYVFQSIGPRDAGNKPLGGASLMEGSVEWRQRISGPWGAVVFVDAGAVGEDAVPGTGGFRVGAGVGLRYLTAIGPIRVDVGVPLNPQRGDPAYGLYVGIGQAF
uniref:autotransporter assembly complex protein TamA n=1 Tax=Roseomonas rosulenta TaxID=2748667 RepID=UPI0018DFC1B8